MFEKDRMSECIDRGFTRRTLSAAVLLLSFPVLGSSAVGAARLNGAHQHRGTVPMTSEAIPAADIQRVADRLAEAEARRRGVRGTARRYNIKRLDAEPGDDDALLHYTVTFAFDQTGRFRAERVQEAEGVVFLTDFAWNGERFTYRAVSPTQDPDRWSAYIGPFDQQQADMLILPGMLGMSHTPDANAPLSSTVRRYGVGLAPAEELGPTGLQFRGEAVVLEHQLAQHSDSVVDPIRRHGSGFAAGSGGRWGRSAFAVRPRTP